MTNETGTYSGLSDDEYRNKRGFSSTMVRRFLDAPAKAQYLLSGEHEPEPPSETLITGQLCHALVLEPETVPHRFAVMPEGLKRTTKAGKQTYAELQQTVGDQGHVVSHKQMMIAEGVRQSVLNHPLASQYLALGQPELSVFVRDPITDVLLCCRCDWLCRYPAVIVDLKTSQTASADGFARHALHYGYHLQAAHYLEVCRLAKIDAHDFVFIAVEKEPPYLCQLFHLSAQLLETTCEQWRLAVNQYAQCVADNHWPGYGNEIVSIEQPRWML